MKKLIITFLTIALLLFAVPVLAVGYHSTGLTSTDSRCSFVDGDSWLWWDGLDFSDYASGNWEIILTDSSGNRARGIAGAVGTGETLGSELVTNGDFANWTGDDPDNWSVAEEDASNYVTENPTGVANIVSDGSIMFMAQYGISTTVDVLYKLSFDLTITTTGWRYIFGVVGRPLSNSTDSGSLIYYGVNTSDALQFYRYLGTSSDYSVDNVSLKQVTEPAATGIHILKGPNGTEGWAEIDSGFDYNAVTEIEIIPLATVQGCTLTGVSTE